MKKMDLFWEIAEYLFLLAIGLVVAGGLTNFWVGAYIERGKVQGLMPLTPASFLGLLVVRFSLFILMAIVGILLFASVLASFRVVLNFFRAAAYLPAFAIIIGAGTTFLATKIVIFWMDGIRAKYSILLLLVSLILTFGMIFLSYESQILFELAVFGIPDAAKWLLIIFVANIILLILMYLHGRVYKTWFSHES